MNVPGVYTQKRSHETIAILVLFGFGYIGRGAGLANRH